jgi:glycosyltransferase involved in cell wall biosynthesis
VVVEYQPEGTISSARNEGARRARGDWLLFLDADDELAPGYLDAMRRAYEREGRARRSAPLLLTPAVQRIEKGRKRPPFFYPEVPLDQANWLVVGTLLEKELFDRAGGFEDYPHGFEDWSLWNKCHRLGARVVKVPHAIYIQYVNPQSKHRQGWRNRRWQVETHQRVARELEAWTP